MLWFAAWSASPSVASEDLIDAISAADVVSVRALLDAGADPDYMDEEGRTPLSEAVSILDADAKDAFVMDDEELTPSSEQVSTSDGPDSALEILQMLVDHGADLNANYEGGVPPLTLLAFTALFSMNFTDTLDENEAPMIYVRFLIENGADPHAKANRPDAPIDGLSAWSAGLGWTEIARILIGAGADVNGRSSDGRTPLMLVAESTSTNTEMIQYLFDNGASLDLQDKAGETALFQALCGPNELEYLISRDDVFRGFENATKLIQLGADVNLPDGHGVTPLMQAVKCLAPENVAAVLEAGGQADRLDETGRSALFHVALGLMAREQELSRGLDAPTIGRDGLQEVVDLLLKAGIDPSLTDTAGETALAAAERFARSEVSSGVGESDMRDLVAILDSASGR